MKIVILAFAALAVAFAQTPAAPAKDTAATTHKEAKKHVKKHAKKTAAATPAPAAR